MHSKSILTGSAALLVACALTLSATAQTAPASAATAPATEPAKPASEAPKPEKKKDEAAKPKNAEGRGNPAERVNKMKASLNLTDDQTAKIKTILEESSAKAKEIRKSGDESPEAHKANRKETFQKINAVLTSEQQAKWHEEMKKGREAKAKKK